MNNYFLAAVAGVIGLLTLYIISPLIFILVGAITAIFIGTATLAIYTLVVGGVIVALIIIFEKLTEK